MSDAETEIYRAKKEFEKELEERVYDCDGCRYFPCTHQHKHGVDVKIKINKCGDYDKFNQ